MALVNDIIVQAFREANYRSIVDAPSPEEEAEALILLEGLCASFLPMVVGARPESQMVTQSITLDNSARLLIVGSVDLSVMLPTVPQSGMVVEYVDSGHTGTVTLDAGLRFFGSTSPQTKVILGPAMPGARARTRRWLYRDDTASWDELVPLRLGHEFPYPDIFADWFVMMLAVRLSPRFGSEPRSMTMMRAKEMEDFIRLYWRQTFPVDTPAPLVGATEQTYGRAF